MTRISILVLTIMPRRFNALETGLGGIVLKNHSYPTVHLASLVSKLVPDIAVFGGICLEYECGGKLVPEAVDILKITKDYDMVLATGHISSREIFALVDKAKQLGVAKIVVTHAMSNFLSESILKPEERQMLAKEGVLIEHCVWQISPTGGRTDPARCCCGDKERRTE